MIGSIVLMSYSNHRFCRKDEAPEPSARALASPLIQKIGRHAVKKSGKDEDGTGTDGTKEKTRPPVARSRVSGEEMANYLASPSSAGLSERSTGFSPSQMRRIAL